MYCIMTTTDFTDLVLRKETLVLVHGKNDKKTKPLAKWGIVRYYKNTIQFRV